MMKNIFLLVLIILLTSSCSSLKTKNRLLSNEKIEFQYDNFLFWKKQPLSPKVKRNSFQFQFLYKFDDSISISTTDKLLFNEKVHTNEITDDSNVLFVIDKNNYDKKLMNLKIPSKNVDVAFYLSKSYSLIYLFYYQEKIIVRYSNYLYL